MSTVHCFLKSMRPSVMAERWKSLSPLWMDSCQIAVKCKNFKLSILIVFGFGPPLGNSMENSSMTQYLYKIYILCLNPWNQYYTLKVKLTERTYHETMNICKLPPTICQVVSLRLGKYSPKVRESKNVTKMWPYLGARWGPQYRRDEKDP